MKIVLALCLVATALAAPQHGRDQLHREPFRILRSETSPIEGANFRYVYETENGIIAEKVGRAGPNGQSIMNGAFSYPLPDGSTASFTYVADEGGYRVDSSSGHLPIAPPMPAHALEQIQIANQQRSQGVQWNQQGFVI